ncbi:MAG: S41 family peptidase [Ardenticatenaceae bacterium]|nr:S41 family peptidase [Anaerolineales bacterium]MCB8921234.1 S41 family peptidase [Ardenticatenaceae bacterium]MCB8990600.1 S41 family peptidase [Ardenticatenaceae bacterium]MCB9004307.1 S41 family peptidase [Ardenticatenaceae bacterium]
MNENATHTEIVEALLEKLRRFYVFPDAAEKICINLQQHLADGDYDDLQDEEFFAYALTTHMQEICHDEHLWVRWHADPLPDEDEVLRLNEQWTVQQQHQARINNYGFHKVERLDGNIGYVDIRSFYRPEWGGDTAVSAMNFLAHTDALIFDLRQCTGGYPGMVALISSYLLGGEPQLLNTIYWRDDDTTQQYWTLPYVPGKKLDDKPLYILISKETFSGGEGFAYDMQARKRATLIGEQTDGGAHPGASYRLHPHFEVFIPIGLPTHPITGTNWEGTGVTPDIATAADQALKTAHKMALAEASKGLGTH